MTRSVNMVIGGYFHTIILEPGKVDQYKIIKSTSRNTKIYKELSDGEICLLEQEADKIQLMREKLFENTTVRDLIQGDNVEYEIPGLAEIKGEVWKGKADIINHDERLIIDLKTTSDIEKFRSSAYRFGYNSQAYLYQRLFNYDMVFVVIDKNTLQLGVYDCSSKFIETGEQRVVDAVENYRLFHKNENFNPKEYYINETL